MPTTFRHHRVFFSLIDGIMPQVRNNKYILSSHVNRFTLFLSSFKFFFAAGFGYRLTMRRPFLSGSYRDSSSHHFRNTRTAHLVDSGTPIQDLRKKALSRIMNLLVIDLILCGVASNDNMEAFKEKGWSMLLLPILSRNFYETLATMATTQVSVLLLLSSLCLLWFDETTPITSFHYDRSTITIIIVATITDPILTRVHHHRH